MATLLDVSLIGFLLPVFVFLFIFTLMFGLLEKWSPFGENKRTLHLVAALSVAAISLFTGQFVGMIALVTPWIIFILVLLFMIFAIFGFFNVKQEETWKLFGQTPVFILILLIVVIGISIMFEDALSPYDQSDKDGTLLVVSESGEVVETSTSPANETIKTLAHPRILGALFILILAAAASRYLADKYEP